MFVGDGFLVDTYAVEQQKKISMGNLGLSAWYVQSIPNILPNTIFYDTRGAGN